VTVASVLKTNEATKKERLKNFYSRVLFIKVKSGIFTDDHHGEENGNFGLHFVYSV
jgi:hypothetical protein